MDKVDWCFIAAMVLYGLAFGLVVAGHIVCAIFGDPPYPPPQKGRKFAIPPNSATLTQ